MTERGIVNIRIENKNPQMKKDLKPHIIKRARSGFAAMGLSVLILAFCLSPAVKATNYQAQINSLNGQNAQTQSLINGLQVQANNYQQAITAYQNQITAIENSIAANQQKQAEYQLEIQQETIVKKTIRITDIE